MTNLLPYDVSDISLLFFLLLENKQTFCHKFTIVQTGKTWFLLEKYVILMETYIQAHTENRDSVLEPLLKRGTHFMRNEGFCKHKTDLHQRFGFMVNSAQGENMDFSISLSRNQNTEPHFVKILLVAPTKR